MRMLEEIVVPHEIPNDKFVKIVRLSFKNGDQVKAEDSVMSVETSKMVMDIFVQHSGIIRYLCAEEEEVKIGQPVARIYSTIEDFQEDQSQKEDPARSQSVDVNATFSKSALALLGEHNIDKSIFAGKGLVSADDVRSYLASRGTDKVQLNAGDSMFSSDVDFVDIPSVKKKEIDNLSVIQGSAMTSLVSVLVDLSDVTRVLDEQANVFRETILLLVLSQLERLLNRYKEFNAFFYKDQIGYYKNVKVGLAINFEGELKVLSLPSQEGKPIAEMDEVVFDLINKYLDRKLPWDAVKPATFTITDLSGQDVDFFIPLIPENQSAVLGLGAFDKTLKRCRMIISFDHRVSDGKKAGMFLKELKNVIEQTAYDMAMELTSAQDQPNLSEQVIEEAVHCYRCFKDLKEDKLFKGTGLLKIVDHSGMERYICRICQEGF